MASVLSNMAALFSPYVLEFSKLNLFHFVGFVHSFAKVSVVYLLKYSDVLNFVLLPFIEKQEFIICFVSLQESVSIWLSVYRCYTSLLVYILIYEHIYKMFKTLL